MEQCQYGAVKTESLTKDETRCHKPWIILLRQVLVCSTVWNSYFITGFCMGGPTVIIPQLRKEANSTDAVSPEMASWMSSVHGYGALPWFFLPFMAERFGRKYPFLMINIIGLISFIVLYFSRTAKEILIAEILQSSTFTCSITISIFIIIEYSSPCNRGLFLTLKSASFNWGMWVANALGTFFHWRAIAIAGIIFSLYNVLVTLYWCESPSWLASKGRYEECVRAQRWIKGTDAISQQELDSLIRHYKESLGGIRKEKKQNCFRKTCKIIVNTSFYKPILLSMAVMSLYHLSGKIICAVYALDIIKSITADENIAYFGMLLLDGVSVSGMYIGCVCAKYLNRKTLLLAGSIGGIFFLFVLSLYLYFVHLMILTENKIVSLALLTFFFILISVGPVILSTSIYGEIMPLRYRTAGMFITGVYALSLLATSLKTAPMIFRIFRLHGGFLFYGVMSSVVTYILHKYLPETKDKTLQEIEEIFLSRPRAKPHQENQVMIASNELN